MQKLEIRISDKEKKTTLVLPFNKINELINVSTLINQVT